MMVRVKLQPILGAYTQDQKLVHVSGRTINECIEILDSEFPGIKQMLYDRHGNPSTIFNISLNGTSMRSDEGFDTPVRDGDEISIELAVFEGG